MRSKRSKLLVIIDHAVKYYDGEIIIINTDGALPKSSRVAGIEGLFRNGQGKLLDVFSKKVQCNWAISSEIEAIYFALLVLRNNKKFNPKLVIINFDSKEAVDILNQVRQKFWCIEDVVGRIGMLSGMFEKFEYRYIERSINWEAD